MKPLYLAQTRPSFEIDDILIGLLGCYGYWSLFGWMLVL